MSHNVMVRQGDERAHLNLQISMLAERETTKILEMMRDLGAHLGHEAPHDEEAHALSQQTEVEPLAHELRRKLRDP